MTNVIELKRALRGELRERLRAADPARLLAESEAICTRLLAQPDFLAARAILGYHPLPTEPDLRPALGGEAAAGRDRVVCLPRWAAARAEYEPALVPANGQLVEGPFGVPEPPAAAPAVDWERLDLVLVPGLAFDRRGWRLGRGRGFYDRILVRARHARRWGVAFDDQVVVDVPHEPHDSNLDLLVTPSLLLHSSMTPRP